MQLRRFLSDKGGLRRLTAAASPAPAFDPATAFTTSELIAWHEPADLTRTYQVHEGKATDLVTTATQRVALMLDQRGLGSELATHPGELTGPGWVHNGGGQYTHTGANYEEVRLAGGALTAGRYYRIAFTKSGTAAGLDVQAGAAAVTDNLASFNSSFMGAQECVLPAETLGGVHAIRLMTGGDGLVISNISIKECLGHQAIQRTTTMRGTYQASPGRVVFADDDVLTIPFGASQGSACTVAYAVAGVGTTILTAQVIGTSYTMSASNCGFMIFNRALVGGETADVTAYLDALAGV